jgi:exonuclease VII small subunit
MPNPNNNMNMYNQALQINRDLKKRIDKANAIVDKLLEYSNIYDEEDYEDAFADLKEILNGR